MQRTHRVTEARRVEGDLTYHDTEELLRSALRDHYAEPDNPNAYVYVWVRDITDEWVAYEYEGPEGCDTFKVGYSVDDANNTVALMGEPERVILKTSYEAVGGVAEGGRLDRVGGRVLEAKGSGANGGRVFRVRIIETGTSRNGVRYTESVLAAAAPLYEGAKAYDHHRTLEELQTSTVDGMVGHYSDVAASASGVDADLNLLPGATHIAEALDASLSVQGQGLSPLVGISHDVRMQSVSAIEGGRQIREATSIDDVLSADVVADPSAGGHATRMVAGGLGNTNTNGEAMNLKEFLDAYSKAAADGRAELLKESDNVALLEAAGYTADDVLTLIGETPAADETGEPTDATATEKEPVAAGATESKRVTEARAPEYERESTFARLLIREAVKDLPEGYEELVRKQIGERFTEAQLTGVVATIQETARAVERASLSPTVKVGEESKDKARERLENTFAAGSGLRGWSGKDCFVRVSEAYSAISGNPYEAMSDDLAQEIVRESWGPIGGYSRRQSESMTTSTWDQVLADVMHKQMVKDYQLSPRQVWRKFCSTAPLIDFRSKKLIRVGGYGTLPTVIEGGTYQPLTSPSDEQATISLSKYGGTEDWTWEMALNDDMKELAVIPGKLGRAAINTLYRYIVGPAVGDAVGILTANPAIYDSVALFHSSHANTAASVTLSRAGLNTLRQKMRDQAAYGDSVEVLGLSPKFLLVPNELEDQAVMLCQSDRANPDTNPGAADQVNSHKGLEPVILDDWTDANDYIAVADPMQVPTIEVGFLNGKENPEMFANDDPAQGAVFSRDVFTLKERFVFGVSVVDYRGMQRYTN